MPLLSGSQRRALCMTPAAICTEGPSRPRDRPASSPQAVRKIFATVSLIETKGSHRRVARPGVRAAITWGMPEPAAPAAKRRVNQTMLAVHKGVQISGAHHCHCRRLWKCSSACSLNQVKPTTVRPDSTAKVSTTARVIQTRQSYNSLRKAL
jgi:hypothetical protein